MDVYKINQTKCLIDNSQIHPDVEDEMDDSDQSELTIYQIDICFPNRTHFEIRQSTVVDGYSIENLGREIGKILMDFENEDNMREYFRIRDSFKYQNCSRVCYVSKEIEMGPHMICPLCKMCEPCDQGEFYGIDLIGCVEVGPVYVDLAFIAVNVIFFLISLIFICKNGMLWTTDYWEFKILNISGLVSVVTALPFVGDYLELCKVQAIFLVSERALLASDALGILKLGNLKLGNFKIKSPKFKDFTLPGVLFFSIFITSTIVVTLVNFRELGRLWCEIDPMWDFLHYVIPLNCLLSAIFIYCSETRHWHLKCLVSVKIVFDIVLRIMKLDDGVKASGSVTLENALVDKVPMIVSLVIKIYQVQISEREGQNAQRVHGHGSVSNSIQLNDGPIELQIVKPRTIQKANSAPELGCETDLN